jgi:hypothetical protein
LVPALLCYADAHGLADAEEAAQQLDILTDGAVLQQQIQSVVLSKTDSCLQCLILIHAC